MSNQSHVEVQIIPFDPNNATDEEWGQLHIYRKIFHEENMADFPYIDNKTFEKSMKARNDDINIVSKTFKIVIDKEIVGTLGINAESQNSSSYQEKKNELIFNIKILKKYRSKKIEFNALNRISEVASQNNRSLLISISVDDYEKSLLESIGAEEASVIRTNKLDLNNLDWSMLEDWVKEAESKNPDLRMEIFNYVPEEIIESYCESATFTAGQMPRDNLRTGKIIITPENLRQRQDVLSKAGIIPINAVILDKNNKVLGLTLMLNRSPQADYIDQQITGVLIEHRGKKLGKWIKAALLLHIREKYPEKKLILTNNAESNDAMLAINNKLGFKKLREENFFQITLDKLEDFLKTNN